MKFDQKQKTTWNIASMGWKEKRESFFSKSSSLSCFQNQTNQAPRSRLSERSINIYIYLSIFYLWTNYLQSVPIRFLSCCMLYCIISFFSFSLVYFSLLVFYAKVFLNMPVYCTSFSLSHILLMTTLSLSSGSASGPSLQCPIPLHIHTFLLQPMVLPNNNMHVFYCPLPLWVKPLVGMLEYSSFLLSNFSVQCLAFFWMTMEKQTKKQKRTTKP